MVIVRVRGVEGRGGGAQGIASDVMWLFWNVVRRELSVSCYNSLLMIHVTCVPFKRQEGTVFWFTLCNIHIYPRIPQYSHTYKLSFYYYYPNEKMDHSNGAEVISDRGKVM